jgi:adenine-specific DNA-methyltransferase
MKVNAHIVPLVNEHPSDYADRLGVVYTKTVSETHKKGKGQFFTPPAIARLMASFSNNRNEEIRILVNIKT